VIALVWVALAVALQLVVFQALDGREVLVNPAHIVGVSETRAGVSGGK
jgi:hypothetical protein